LRWLSWPRCPRLTFKEPQKFKADAAHGEALLDSYELLQQLHDHGVFDLLRGALGASDRLIETAVDVTKSNESISAMRNAILLGKVRVRVFKIPRARRFH